MKVKVFEKNDKGKIEFTRKELEALLNEVFNDGYQEGKSQTFTWTSPSITWNETNMPNLTPLKTGPYYNTTTCECINNSSTATNRDVCEHVYYGVEDDDYTEGQMSLNLTMVK